MNYFFPVRSASKHTRGLFLDVDVKKENKIWKSEKSANTYTCVANPVARRAGFAEPTERC